MTPAELVGRLKQDEDPYVERKTQGARSDVVEALVAFANSVPPGREAVLFLGVRPDKTAVGVGDADKLQRSISEWARNECYPPIAVTYEVLTDIAPRPVLAVIVQASDERPHFAGPAYVRDGSKSVKATRAVYEELIASRNTKAGAIMRHKGDVVTVEEIHRPPYGGPPNRSVQEYRIEGCTAHSVQLSLLSAGTNRSVPLEQVTLSADPEHLRPLKLIIKPLI